jgi:hypothetical protein
VVEGHGGRTALARAIDREQDNLNALFYREDVEVDSPCLIHLRQQNRRKVGVCDTHEFLDLVLRNGTQLRTLVEGVEAVEALRQMRMLVSLGLQWFRQCDQSISGVGRAQG